MKLLAALPLILSLCTQACLLPHERQGIRARLPHPRAPTGMPIGQGDRFNNGSSVPQGLGTAERNLLSILNVDEVASGLQGLAKAFPSVKLFETPYKTHENRSLHGAVIGAEPRAFIMSGVHARERGGPDHVLYFMSDLLAAARDATGVKYGSKTYTNAQVNAALSAGVLVLPLTNPDGVRYDQQTGTCWRKNRNGVDLNRNFDFMWDFRRYFSASVADQAASDDPRSEVYHGSAPASEPEVRSVQWLMAQHPGVSWFLDLHSFGGDVLYSWGDDKTQTTNASENFANPAWDHERGRQGGSYGEYLEAGDYGAQAALAQRMCDAMNEAGGVRYAAEESSALYPTSGASTDYGLGLYYGHKCGANRIQGITLEFGGESGLACPFYPTSEQYHGSMRQVATGLMEFLLTAAGSDGRPTFWTC